MTEEKSLVPITEVPKPARRTKKTVNAYVDRLVSANTPEIADAMVKAIMAQLEAADVKTVQLVAQMLGLVKAPGGGINNTINNVNANIQTGKGRRGIESIIHDLEASRPPTVQVIDAEFSNVGDDE